MLRVIRVITEASIL